MSKEEFTIPQLLMEREQKKQREYDERKSVDVKEIGLATGDIATMKELDFMYGGRTTQEELEDMEDEDDMKALDPYM